ncbi:MAG TPA: class I SAM-dependent methyltransferase [Alphaproteobacteria bacterium]|nr:class I SAM-dependent methyltransferase [Alphaproteobacteria bacterium]
MDQAFERVLHRYNKRAAEEAELFRDSNFDGFKHRDELLLHVGEKVARVLRDLAVARGAKRIVELGTSYGYSTLFLADAARATGGRLVTLDVSEKKQAYARSQLEEAGLNDHVDWLLGDALTLLDELAGDIDFVLIDIWKDLYVPCFEKLYPKLADNALIAADNILYPEEARPDVARYQAAVRDKLDLQSVLLPIGSGIELSCVWREEPR